ncbi:hypothetical protein [Flavobacterium sp. 3HN19-14]|uniref:hypothetical protein n=1 Tax=Flavobacterium sp. 3HN19-14 TaxID=3448133 RepID=UPI003EE0D298
MNKDFLYLIQGSKENVLKYGHLQNESSDLFALTFDYEINAEEMAFAAYVYFPKSTWAEGRNLQLEMAKKWKKRYLYYIFIDDDAALVKGSFADFQQQLLVNRPAIGVPLLTIIKNTNRYNPKLKIQHPVAVDQQVQAYHYKVLEENFAMPLVTAFDNMSWWYSCEINGFMILSKYRGFLMQFNEIEVDNEGHNWDAETNQSTIAASSYLGGTTAEGLKMVREFIELEFGLQPALQNSLFHNVAYERKVYLPKGKLLRKRYFDYLKKGKWNNLLQLMKQQLRNFGNNYPAQDVIDESVFSNFENVSSRKISGNE